MFFVRARLQPCRKSRIFSAALAAEGMKLKFSHRLFQAITPFFRLARISHVRFPGYSAKWNSNSQFPIT
jgi:hypothetical protein